MRKKGDITSTDGTLNNYYVMVEFLLLVLDSSSVRNLMSCDTEGLIDDKI